MRIVSAQVSLNASTSTVRTTTASVQGRLWTTASEVSSDVRISDEARASALGQSTSVVSVLTQSGSNQALARASRQTEGSFSRSAGGPTSIRDSSRPSAPSSNEAASERTLDGSVNAASDDSQLLGSAEGTKLVVLRRLLEAMTGRKIRLVRPDDLKPIATAQTAPSEVARPSPDMATAPAAANSSHAQAGWSLALDIERTHVEATSVDFSARGTIVTEDGKAIQFDASFLKQSSAITVEKISLRAGDAALKDPLVLLYSGTHAELTEQTQAFDLEANGQPVQLRGLSNGAYVVEDLNHNKKVDDGREMLGAMSGDGFADLRALDEDGNGFVDGADRAFSALALWQPSATEGGTLTSLVDAGIQGLYTGNAATPFDLRTAPNGALLGRVRTTGIYVTEEGQVRPLEQLDLKL